MGGDAHVHFGDVAEKLIEQGCRLGLVPRRRAEAGWPNDAQNVLERRPGVIDKAVEQKRKECLQPLQVHCSVRRGADVFLEVGRDQEAQLVSSQHRVFGRLALLGWWLRGRRLAGSLRGGWHGG
jgi:hypothetical protein